jgi:hypothetical protein
MQMLISHYPEGTNSSGSVKKRNGILYTERLTILYGRKLPDVAVLQNDLSLNLPLHH